MSDLHDDIIKYRSGRLTAKEMHALERKALNDPFLADALEGIENVSAEELAGDIGELNQRLVKKRKAILFTPLRIAAGVILLAAIVVGLYRLTPETKTIALKNEKQAPPVSAPKNEPTVETVPGAGTATDKTETRKAVGSANTERGRTEKEARKESTPTESVAAENSGPKIEAIKPKHEEKLDEADAQTSSVPEKKTEEVKAQVTEAPVSITMQPAQSLATGDDAKQEQVPSRGRRYAAKSDASGSNVATGAPLVNPRRITGKVTAADDGAPLPGVNVVVTGTTQGTVTDTQGNFSLQPSGESQKLTFSFIGMETQELNVAGKDKIDVSLKQDASQLSEVVVAGYGVKKDDDAEPIVHLASPIGGMRAYNKYLDKNVRYPREALQDKIKGKVKVEFSVKTDGSLDDYRVVKSLGHGCDEEVIRLIKEGPPWSPTTENGQAVESTVLIGVKFDPAKAGK